MKCSGFVRISKNFYLICFLFCGLVHGMTRKKRQLYLNIQDKSYPGVIEKSLSVSALTLNLWRMFDEQKTDAST